MCNTMLAIYAKKIRKAINFSMLIKPRNETKINPITFQKMFLNFDLVDSHAMSTRSRIYALMAFLLN